VSTLQIARGAMNTWGTFKFPGTLPSGAESSIHSHYCKGYVWQNTSAFTKRVTININFMSWPIADEPEPTPSSLGWGFLFEFYTRYPQTPNWGAPGGRTYKRAIDGPTPVPFLDGSASIAPYPVLIYTAHSSTLADVLWPAGQYLVIRLDNKSGWRMGITDVEIEMLFD
jgi:hypothetical protein